MTSNPALTILRFARRIVEDGGDANPCRLGRYCLYCCVAIAKKDLDDVAGTLYDQFHLQMMMARDMVNVYDDGIKHHTKESALEVLNKAIADAEVYR